MNALRSLRIRLGLLLVIAFGPILGLTVYWSYLDQTARLAEVEASELRLARQVATTYQQILDRARELLIALSEFDALRAGDAKACNALLARLMPQYPQYLNISVADLDGNLFCSGQSNARGVNVKHTAIFARAVQTRAFALGELERSGITGQLVLIAAYPVLDKHGAPRGYAATILTADWLNALAAEIALPQGASVALVDSAGNIVVRQPEAAKWVGHNVSRNPFFAARQRGVSRYEGKAVDGVMRRFVTADIEGVPAPARLWVTVGIDTAQALAPIHAALYRDLGVVAGVALIAFLLAWFGTEKTVIQRVNALLAATRRLAAGDLAARAGDARPGGTTELQQLGQAFDDMAAALQRREREASDSRKALAEQESLLRTVVETLPVGVWIVGADGRIVTGNPQAIQIWGGVRHVGVDDYGVYKGWWADTGKPIAAREWGVARALATGERSINEIIDIEAFDGTRKTIAHWAVPLRGAGEAIVGAIAVNQDITASQRAEEALRESERTLATLIGNLPGVVYRCRNDKDWTVQFISEGAHALTGYAGADFLGQRITYGQLIHPDDQQPVWDRIQEALHEKRPYQLVYRIRTRSGDEKWVWEQGLGVFSPAGELLFLEGFITDITARERAEEARRQLEAQLRQAQKMEALGTLAGGIAHDFNNILGAIIGNVELARQDVGADHPAQQSLAEIGKASARARDLVQQILTFSRQQAQARRVIRLREVAEESVKLLRATLPAGIELVTDVASDTPNVLADRTQIHQVLMNLCANAWQAIEGPVGRIKIAIAGVTVPDRASRPALPPGRYARLSVTDTGKGMDAATLERIFDPFFTTKAVGEGTGLGLAVVDGIVKSHGGAIVVDSAPGKGAAFHLYFPAAEGEAQPREARPAALPRGAGQRILYLDDEEALVLLATRLLNRLGYEVKGYTRAAEALAAFNADPSGFDLFVSDLNMPSASGLEIATEVLRQRPDLPVALASGYVTEALLGQARAIGIREVIYKPNTVDELAAAIGRLLSDLKGAPSTGAES